MSNHTLTSSQLATLKAAILANPTWNAFPNNDDGHFNLAVLLNQIASPTYTVWRRTVGITETGKKFVGTEWASLSAANHTRLQTVAQWLADGYDASLADIRAMFDDIWSGSGGTLTRSALLALWKRAATSVEKLFATGTGTDTAPATLVFEGMVTPSEVGTARNLP